MDSTGISDSYLYGHGGMLFGHLFVPVFRIKEKQTPHQRKACFSIIF